MLYLTVFIGFALAAMIASSVAHTVSAWRYAMGLAVAASLPLVVWSARGLQALGAYLSVGIDSMAALSLVAVPFSLVLVRLWIRRRNTPRHTPSAEDDPVYRRFLEEKRRRRRLRRQQEEALENGEEPIHIVPFDRRTEDSELNDQGGR